MASMIEIRDTAIMALLTQLQDKVGDMSPVLRAIGDDMTERIKQRFATATGPDGVKWQSNSQVTLMRYLAKRGGFSKKGKISAKGQKLAVSKRPLQGESGDLARQIFPDVTPESLIVGSSMRYAAMQHFGGTKAQFPHLWGNIPARPFFPATSTDELYPAETDRIVDALREFLLA